MSSPKNPYENLIKVMSEGNDITEETQTLAPESPKRTITEAKRNIRKMINPSLLVSNPHNHFSMDRDEEYMELLQSLKKDGMLQSIVVKPVNKDGTYTILSGHRRRAGALEVGLEKVPIEIRAETFSEAEEVAFIGRGNVGTRQKYPYDYAAQVKEYFSFLGDIPSLEKIEQTMSAFSCSQRSIYKYANLAKLPDVIIALGQKRILTVPQGEYLVSVLQKADTAKHAQTAIEALSACEQTPMAVAAILKRLKRTCAGKEEKKYINATTYAKKLLKASDISNFDFTIPRAKDRAQRTLDEMLAVKENIEVLISKLQEKVNE